MTDLLSTVDSVPNTVDKKLLDCLERLVAIFEASHNPGEGVFESLRHRLTLSDILGIPSCQQSGLCVSLNGGVWLG